MTSQKIRASASCRRAPRRAGRPSDTSRAWAGWKPGAKSLIGALEALQALAVQRVAKQEQAAGPLPKLSEEK